MKNLKSDKFFKNRLLKENVPYQNAFPPIGLQIV